MWLFLGLFGFAVRPVVFHLDYLRGGDDKGSFVLGIVEEHATSSCPNNSQACLRGLFIGAGSCSVPDTRKRLVLAD
jgi:hypothetical protein